ALATSHHHHSLLHNLGEIAVCLTMGYQCFRQASCEVRYMRKGSDTRGNNHRTGLYRSPILQIKVKSFPIRRERFHVGLINLRNDVLLEPLTVFEKGLQRDRLLARNTS